jgi:hypothetical protein
MPIPDNDFSFQVQSLYDQSVHMKMQLNNGRVAASHKSSTGQDRDEGEMLEERTSREESLGQGRRDVEDATSDVDNLEDGFNEIPIRSLQSLGEGGGTLLTRLVNRKPRSSRRHNEQEHGASNPINLKHNRSFRSNNSHHHSKDGNDGERIIIDEEGQQQQHDNRILDYTTAMIEGNSSGHNKKVRNNLSRSNSNSKMRGINEGGNANLKLGFPNALPPPLPPTSSPHHHLPFLRNWSPTLSHHHHAAMTPPPGLNRSSVSNFSFPFRALFFISCIKEKASLVDSIKANMHDIDIYTASFRC